MNSSLQQLIGNTFQRVQNKLIPDSTLNEDLLNEKTKEQIGEIVQEYLEEPLEKPVMDEISSSKSELFAHYEFKPYNPDDLVGRKSLTVYEKARIDDQVKAVLNTKKFIRLAPKWEIISFSQSKEDMEVADFVRWNFENMEGSLETDIYEMMTALDFGFSITEIVWQMLENGPFKGKIGLKALKTRKPFRFDFKTDNHDNLEYIIQESSDEGDVKLDPKKFIVFSYQKEFDNYYGMSDLRAAYRSIFSKDVITRFWNIWLERFPSPIALGFYPSGVPKKERDNLLNILKRIQIATAAILPDYLEIEFKEGKSTGHEVFKEAIEYHNKAIAHALLCPDLLGFTEMKGPGSYALGRTHVDVFLAVLDRLGNVIEGPILLEQCIKRLVNYNYVVSGYPQFRWEALSEENTEIRAKVMTMLVSAGLVDPAESWVREYLNLPSSSQPSLKNNLTSPNSPKKSKPSSNQSDNPDENSDNSNGVLSRFESKMSTADNLGSPNTGKIAIELQESSNLSRSLTLYEEKAGFKPSEFFNTMETWVGTSTEIVAEEVKNLISSVVKQVNSKKILEQKSYRLAREIEINPRKVRSQLMNCLMYSYFLGKEAGLSEVEKALGEKIEFSDLNLTATLEYGDDRNRDDDFWKVLPSEALKQFRKRVPEPFLKKGYSKAYQREENKAFYIAGIIEKDVLGSVQELLVKSIEGGWTLEEFENQVRQRNIEYTGEVYGRERRAEPLKPYHLETILRTNFSDIYHYGKKQAFDDPDVIDFVPAFQYSGILDLRIRSNHKAMDGKIYPRGDPIWKKWWAPVGFNCLIEGTLITTRQSASNHRIPIEKMKKGSLVYTHLANWKPVIGLHKNWFEGELVVLKTANDEEISCTPNHEILTNEGWKRADELDLCDKLISIGTIRTKKQWEGNDERKKKAAQWARENLAGRKKPNTEFDHPCPTCGKMVHQTKSEKLLNMRTYCSVKCAGKAGALSRSLENNGMWEGGKSFIDYPFQFNGTLKREIRERDNNSCSLDPTHTGFLHIHHIDEDKNNNDPSNLITLCNSCHNKLHFNKIDKDKINQILQIRAIVQSDPEKFEISAIASNPGIKRIPYSGWVYNLSVLDDESYFANFLAVHNCRCTIIPVTTAQEFTISDPLPPDITPDPGFGGLEEERDRPKKPPPPPPAILPTRTDGLTEKDLEKIDTAIDKAMEATTEEEGFRKYQDFSRQRETIREDLFKKVGLSLEDVLQLNRYESDWAEKSESEGAVSIVALNNILNGQSKKFGMGTNQMRKLTKIAFDPTPQGIRAAAVWREFNRGVLRKTYGSDKITTYRGVKGAYAEKIIEATKETGSDTARFAARSLSSESLSGKIAWDFAESGRKKSVIIERIIDIDDIWNSVHTSTELAGISEYEVMGGSKTGFVEGKLIDLFSFGIDERKQWINDRKPN